MKNRRSGSAFALLALFAPGAIAAVGPTFESGIFDATGCQSHGPLAPRHQPVTLTRQEQPLMSEGPGDEMPTWYSGDGFEELRHSALAQ